MTPSRARLFRSIVLSGVALGGCGRTPLPRSPVVLADGGAADLAAPVPPPEDLAVEPPPPGPTCPCDGGGPCCTPPDDKGLCYPCYL